MFTGLVEEVGTVVWIRATERGTQLQLQAPEISRAARKGDSISVNGCCLTIRSLREDLITFDLLEETLDRTNLKMLRRDSRVNLERPLAADGRLGGHFVQGHIDCAAPVLGFAAVEKDYRLEVEVPPQFSYYLISKGSIAINGISLTVAEVSATSAVVWIIPHTRRHTNLETIQAGDLVNLEFDLLAKYVERMLSRYEAEP